MGSCCLSFLRFHSCFDAGLLSEIGAAYRLGVCGLNPGGFCQVKPGLLKMRVDMNTGVS